MYNLRDAVPRDRIIEIFPNAKEIVCAENVQQWLEARAKDVPPTLMYIWDSIVHLCITKEPMKISPVVNNNFEGLYEFVENELGEPPVGDAFAAEFFNENDEENSFVEVSLVRCFPNDIHISDIEFSDNRRPVDPDDPQQYRAYHGLHVFGYFLEALKEIGKQQGAAQISLNVANPAVHYVFERYGFKINETEVSLTGFKHRGCGHSMILPL